MNKAQKSKVVLDSLEKVCCSPTPVTWQEIVESIKTNSGFEIKNWLTEVRSILQYDINRGRIARTNCTKTESYYKV